MGSSGHERMGRRRSSAVNESTRRLLERRRRRAKLHGGSGKRTLCCSSSTNLKKFANGSGNFGARTVAVMVMLCAVFALALQLGMHGAHEPFRWSKQPSWQRFHSAKNPTSIPVQGHVGGWPGEKNRRFDEKRTGQSAGGIIPAGTSHSKLIKKVTAEQTREEMAKATRAREHWRSPVNERLRHVDPSKRTPAPPDKIEGPDANQAGERKVFDDYSVASKAKNRLSVSVYHDPADEVSLKYGNMAGSGTVAKAGPMEVYLTEGGKLPILLLTCNRATLLQQTIASLRNVHGIDMSHVMVLQDGTDQSVKTVVEREGLYLNQNTMKPSLRGSDGAARIATHYKYALDHVFERATEAPGVIIVEDDLLFSPDFLEFFESNAPVLERDESTLVLSAWNDNGYRGRVADKAELQRTMFFPGLGWLLSKKLYDELRPKWPRSHWDHWLRDAKQHNWRECVFPEVPRTYHNGIKGTFMDQQTHDRLFKNIDYNTDPTFSWAEAAKAVADWHGVGPPTYARALSGNYERRVRARIEAARHINDLDDFEGAAGSREEIVFWYNMPRTEAQANGRPPFKPLADFFGLWHEYNRAEHSGMHTFRLGGEKGAHVMLINTATSPYIDLLPPDLTAATVGHLKGNDKHGGAVGDGGGLGDAEIQRRKSIMKAVAADELDVSCTAICSSKGMSCDEEMFVHLNYCTTLKAHFPCTECAASLGPDQPCYVSSDAPSVNHPGRCLLSDQPLDSRCSASHALTRRLCPCTP